MTAPSNTEGYTASTPDSPDRNRQRNLVDDHNHGHNDGYNQGHVTGGTELHPHHQAQSQRRLSRASSRRASVVSPVNYDVPDDYANLEASNISPVQNPDEESITRHETLEQVRSRDQDYLREQKQQRREEPESSENYYEREKGQEKGEQHAKRQQKVSRLATELYTISYLIFFSLLGTLARLGLQALTSSYPQSPIIFPSIWPNFAGCVVMGFLAEDRMLFRASDWGQQSTTAPKPKKDDDDEETGGSVPAEKADIDPAAAKKAHLSLKKTIPLYIGLATGFCGSFTSFSSFIRDIFLALSNDLAAHDTTPVSRNGGYSFLALLSVGITTISLSLAGLFLGAHLAIAFSPLFTRFSLTLPYTFVSRILDRLAVLLGFGCWLGAVLLSIFPPDRHSIPNESEERWRGSATFALVFAPLGCLLRFYASAHLNGRLPSFPLGTFVVNMFGTAVLGMAWDLAHMPSLGGVVGCQVLQGVADGFCGCLTTVSTWVSELAALRRRHAYVYGGVSVGGGLALLVVVMGSLRWTEGFGEVRCLH
ncbi:CrcB-like protein-domain-containing protein [Neurospora tetraspora]|uniref:CrcB-like protein-domain-containing protein n=1 Tax=Neurospora tetraspora TaxID=94610 RepID=A0AAE0JAD7_9PEZI|nr:CrcB-like protein-domain-containing protein [Neurospora tetraspora]